MTQQYKKRADMPGETFQLDDFKVTAHDIADADVRTLLALSVSVGWSHRAEDWEFMRSVGQGQVAMDESGRVHGSVMWFPFGDERASIGMLITAPRLQTNGGGQWLMHRVLEQTQGRTLGLHATDRSHRLFRSLGFNDEGIVYQYEGHVSAPPEPAPAPHPEVREFAPSYLPALRSLDRMATGWPRDTLIDALVERSRGMVLVRDGRLDACTLMRPFGRGKVIGPLFARSEADALNVLRPMMVDQAGRYVRIDLRDETSDLARFVRQCGLRVVEKVTRMSRGEPWPFSSVHTPSQFALASHATG
ncbi:MAG: GNAT family N-acetyltransferase [Vicinamibacterales bacterium]